MPIPDGTFIHHVHLRAADLERSVSFYVSVLGLNEIARTRTQVLLSASGGAPAQLVLSGAPEAKRRDPFTPGLFHVAWKVPERQYFAEVIRHFLSRQIPLQGFADHGVSEAVYLADPEGNGIEVYCDRPREEWPRKDGRIEMVTEPLDVERLLKMFDHSPNSLKLDERTAIGHIHLQVSDLGVARRFYHEYLGFDIVQDSYPGALFVAAGGYHHHIGLNTWNSRGSRPSRTVMTGLVSFGIALPDAAHIRELRTRLEWNGNDLSSTGTDSFLVEDPDHLQIEVVQQSLAESNVISSQS